APAPARAGGRSAGTCLLRDAPGLPPGAGGTCSAPRISGSRPWAVAAGGSITARASARVPSPVAAETRNAGPVKPRPCTMEMARARASSGGTRSILFSTSQRGLAASAGSYFSSSATMARASRTGSASGSGGAMSIRCSSMRVRCRCLRKRWPSPAPSAAPSIRPGISAITKLRCSPTSTTPRFGYSVVKGQSATRGRAADTARINVDLPALGKPSRPTSAITFISKRSVRFSPGRPGPYWRGARLVLDLKRVLPKPPLPPCATFSVCPAVFRSPSSSPVSSSTIVVPTGTSTKRSSPPRPVQSLPEPPSPLRARKVRWMRKSASVLMPSFACSQTLPPMPPSPPSGPPKGMNFSRRKLTQPRPPLPACTLTVASSTNFIAADSRDANPGARPGSWTIGCGVEPALVGRHHVHVGAAFRTLLLELHLAADQCEQRMVGADAHATAGAHRRAALAHQDIAGQHRFAAEALHAQALAVGFAAVASTAACFLVCHVSLPLSDGGDLHQRVLLAMIAPALVMLATTELHDHLLLALAVALDGR